MLNEKAFRAIYDDFLDSGLTIRDFCLNQKMNEAKFFYWQNKLKGLLPPKRGFVPVIFNKDQQQDQSSQFPVALNNRPGALFERTSSAGSISCEISYPTGICVKVNGLTDLEMLRSLLISTRR
jgi:hypothetical protein